MGAACSICSHPEREQIDADIVAGAPNRAVARKWRELSKDAVLRHRASHISAGLARVVAEREEAGPRTALDRLEELYLEAKLVLNSAREGGQAGLSLQAIRELRGLVETLAKITGELDERPQFAVVNVATSPEHVRMRTVLMQALAPYPDAATAVARRLAELEVDA